MSILAVAAVAAIVASSFYTAYPSAGPLFGKVSFGAIAGGAPLVKVSAAGSGSAVIAGKFGGGTPLVNASVALASYTPRAQPFVTLQAPTTIASYSFWS
jgi:hypothetical protein